MTKGMTTSPRLRVMASHVWTSVLDFFFPPRCVSCRWPGVWLCASCREKIELIRPPICQRCGQSIASGRLCETCQRRPPTLDGLRAAAYFDGPLREAIHALKYRGIRELARPLGELLAQAYQSQTLPAALFIPVPLYKARLDQRGFNQSTLLAEEVAVRAHLPVVRDGLVRTRNTLSQVGLSAAARRENVREAFAWRGSPLDGQCALLIDDVCTTGATMEACAAALRQAGATSVWGLALARERWSGASPAAGTL